MDPVFTQLQFVAFAALLSLGVAIQFAFSPKRRAVMGNIKFLLADALRTAPSIAGVTLVRGAYRAGYLNEGRGFIEANLRSIVWMSGAILAGQVAVRFVPPMSWLARDLRLAGRAVWSERLGRWMGSNR
ncbi:hypothetical protein IFJ75_07635 [Brevundimonas goettingensis]|uniref:Uncharacterized protein n=1 Tax=Brevundimonas goettingensis TaxID=2774190 RepID=A0A975C3B2_9CAUL|nr:hypothetical protein IFJ75_07635 [Brevundimonas goettingensis]